MPHIKYENFGKDQTNDREKYFVYIKKDDRRDWCSNRNGYFIFPLTTDKDKNKTELDKVFDRLKGNKDLHKYKEIIFHNKDFSEDLINVELTRTTFSYFRQKVNELRKELNKSGAPAPTSAVPTSVASTSAAPTSVAPTTPGRSVKSKKDCNSDEFFHHDSKECRKCPSGSRPNKKKNKCVPEPKSVEPHKREEHNNKKNHHRHNHKNHKSNHKGKNSKESKTEKRCYSSRECRSDEKCNKKTRKCVKIKKDKERRYRSAMENSNRNSVGLLTRMRNAIEDAELLCDLCKKNETYLKTQLFPSRKFAITRRFINRLKVAEQECIGCLRKCHFLKKNTKKSTLKDRDIFEARYPKLCKGDSSNKVRAIQIKKALRKKLLDQYRLINK